VHYNLIFFFKSSSKENEQHSSAMLERQEYGKTKYFIKRNINLITAIKTIPTYLLYNDISKIFSKRKQRQKESKKTPWINFILHSVTRRHHTTLYPLLHDIMRDEFLDSRNCGFYNEGFDLLIKTMNFTFIGGRI
jgi:hypothetical protein